jgi:hypothetical protein
MTYKSVPIAIDFDGTCVTHEYPEVGRDIGAAPVIRLLTDQGALIILHTMRSGEQLQAAVWWFESNDITLWGINTNPGQSSWSNSPKPYAKIYIDDAALGCPLIYPGQPGFVSPNVPGIKPPRPHADWVAIKLLLFPQ